MTVGAGITVQDGSLVALGTKILTEVRDDVLVTPATGGGMMNGAFLGVRSAPAGSRSVIPIGKLRNLRFMCTFRFKIWWMTQRMGSSGRDIPFETQFLIVEGADGSHFTGASAGDEQSAVYTVFLPILEGSFRAVLQGNADDELEICLESGDPAVESFEGTHLVFVGAGSDPFEVITNAVKAVERHLQTFSHREKKKMPDMLNWFGWCTWDAFYTDVTAEGVNEGLQSLEKGGTCPKFVIIDDGWQSVSMDPAGIARISDNAANFANRLTHIKENHKFQKNGREGHREDNPANGLAHIVTEIKRKYELKYVYVWHAITGYWGGVRPGGDGMEHYDSNMQYPVSSPGVQKNEPCDALNSITTNGLGLVNPEKVFSFYNELHSYLASAGIDGVKVDVQNILETLGAGHGGRVLLARKYHQALEASIARNFCDNGIISCMSHNTDNLYSSKRSAVVRASDDFWPRDPASHTIHIASVAYNTVFLGEFMQPDWDMFHSVHPMAEYHAAARAVGGCAIYVSDKPGSHNFDLLKKLVLPDGSILRAKLPGRPTRDCLFSDPARDGKSILKIWNLNEHSGVIGAFNCQGAGWCRVGKKNLIHDEQPGTITGVIRARDVDYLPKIANDNWNGDVIVYSHIGGEVIFLPKDASLPLTLKPREYELFTVVPLKHLPNGAAFAPIGLTRMFNSGGAVKEVSWILRKATPAFGKLAALEAKLEGDFRAAHSRLIINAEEISFYGGAKTELSILNRAFLRLVKHVSSILKVRIAFNMCEDFVLKYAWSAAGYVIIASPFLFGLKPTPGRAIEEKAESASSPASDDQNQAGVAQKTESYISNRRLLLSLADAGSRLMYSYKELAELSGYTNRVYTLISTLHLLNRNVYEGLERPLDIAADQPWYDMSNISGKVTMGDETITFDKVPIVAPAPGSARGGERLVKDLSLVMKPGTHILLTGANGVGKSAVARVIAGLWPVWSGELKRPSKKDIFFLPQRPYLSAGSLREQVLYPTTFPEWKASGGTDEELLKILKDVNLAYLPDREGGYETRKEWKDVLSGGEKQRINFARLLFHKPKFAVLDECTSAVSTDVEGGMYATAKATGISLLTISTRLTLLKYHDVLLRLTGDAGDEEGHPSWEFEVLSSGQDQQTADGAEDEGPKGLQEEKRELKKKLAEEETWKSRLEKIKHQMDSLK